MLQNDKSLVLVGGGGHCKAVIDVALSAGRHILGILDGALATGDLILGVPVLGDDDIMPLLVNKYGSSIEFIITVGQLKSSAVRLMLASKIFAAGASIADPLFSPFALVAASASIGKGTVVMHNAVVNADASIADNCIINTAAIVEHDCKIGSFCHISTGAIVNGTCAIGDNSFIGSRSVVINNINIANNVSLGAGSVVIHDIPDSGSFCGVPAHPIINNHS